MERPLIDVVVPVYKVEDYLGECIESILGQTYENIRLFLVDDGSPDKCGEICDQYAAKDDRVHVIHKENAGVAMARNDGIDVADAPFIIFADSDDYYEKDAIQHLYDLQQQYDADCVVGGCVKLFEQPDKTYELENTTLKDGVAEKVSADEAMKKVLLNGSAIWNRLFKREIFKELRFPAGRVNDDEYTVLRAYNICNTVVFSQHPTYIYRIRANSITTSSFSLRKVDVFKNALDNMNFIKEERPHLVKEAEFKYIFSALYCYWNLRRMDRGEKENEAFKNIKTELKTDSMRAIKKNNPYLKLPYKLLYDLIVIGLI